MRDPRLEIEEELERLERDGYCANPLDLIEDALSLLLPPEQISTTECAAKHRYLPNPEGSGTRLWSKDLTPYMNGIQDALDHPLVRTVAVSGPARSGKSIAGENHLFKRLRHGPLTDTLIYLPGKTDVDSYADKELDGFFSLHPEIGSKLGKRPQDNKRTFKRVAGRAIQVMAANLNTVRQRQAPLILATEIDGYRPALRNNFKQRTDERMRAFGNQGKCYIESHPDAGWTSGIALIWKESSRGLWYWPCPHCDGWSCPHPVAPPEMHMRLHIDRGPEGMSDDDRLDHVEDHAGMVCPHCGVVITDDQKAAMLAAGKWVFEGQTITVDGAVNGDIRSMDCMGFMIHGTMSPLVSWNKLAREYDAALVFFERTRKPERLKEFTAKSLGEVYEGAGQGSRVIDATMLEKAAAAAEKIGHRFEIGTAPDDVVFVTAAVDVGGSKFDVLIRGYDLEGRRWHIDRFTIREWNGREVRPGERIEDWTVLEHRVLQRLIPLASDPGMGLPIAGMAIDTGGSDGVTWKAREFARRMMRRGVSGQAGYRIRLIKGRSSKTAPEIIARREINRDDQGKPVQPSVIEFDLNVDRLKATELECLAENEGGPGQCYFAHDLPKAVFAELCGEVLIDGKWERRGPNETLDLAGYCEAVRILLDPDRAAIRWDVRPPVWARPVMIVKEDSGTAAAAPAAPAKKLSRLERMAALNRR